MCGIEVDVHVEKYNLNVSVILILISITLRSVIFVSIYKWPWVQSLYTYEILVQCKNHNDKKYGI